MLDQRRSIASDTCAARAARAGGSAECRVVVAAYLPDLAAVVAALHRGGGIGADIGIFGLVGKGGFELSGKQLLTTSFSDGWLPEPLR